MSEKYNVVIHVFLSGDASGKVSMTMQEYSDLLDKLDSGDPAQRHMAHETVFDLMQKQILEGVEIDDVDECQIIPDSPAA